MRVLWLLVPLMGCTAIRPLAPTDASTRDGGARDAASLRDAGAPIDAGDPGCAALELCDGIDNDCDPSSLDGADEPTLRMACDGDDEDSCEDGQWLCVDGALACGDDALSHPERCGGGDEDCDGQTDEMGAEDAPLWGPDRDGDSYGTSTGAIRACVRPAEHDADLGDCDDTMDTVNPGAPEVCNGIDDNCDSTVDDGVSCGVSCAWRAYGGHTYQFCDTTEPWMTARALCQSIGYDLVIISDAAENAFVAGGASRDNVWIGLSRLSGLMYEWVDGSGLAYANWEAGSPGGGECVRLRAASGEWEDVPCSTLRSYVCESL